MQASNKPMNIEQDNNLREQFETVLMNLEVEQAARRDTSLEVEKLNVQLDISKKSYYELEARFNHEKAIWRIKEENYEKKLQSKAITEKEISGLLLNLNSDVPESATFSKTGNLYSKPMTNTVNLLKKIQELKGEIDNLRSELVNKCQEIEELNKSINWKSFANQPTSCLYQTLSQRDSQIHVLHNQLVDTEKQAQLYKEERDKLAHERRILCEDLERLLTRRQSLAKLREFVSSLLQQIQPNLSLRLLKNQNDLLCPRDMNCGCNLTGRPSSHRETPFDHISDHNRVSNIHQQFYDILRSQ
ncbi:unnamed protein product [Heterobilharzia americana]|nr:unnamed protein product [Heterobilharzia americana]